MKFDSIRNFYILSQKKSSIFINLFLNFQVILCDISKAQLNAVRPIAPELLYDPASIEGKFIITF